MLVCRHPDAFPSHAVMFHPKIRGHTHAVCTGIWRHFCSSIHYSWCNLRTSGKTFLPSVTLLKNIRQVLLKIFSRTGSMGSTARNPTRFGS